MILRTSSPPSTTAKSAVLNYFSQITTTGAKPVLRVPMTASYWLNVKTKAASANMEKYPDLSGQYQTMITNMVERFTKEGAVVILDLHWSDDDTE